MVASQAGARDARYAHYDPSARTCSIAADIYIGGVDVMFSGDMSTAMATP